MNTTYKINNDTTLVVLLFSYSEFEYIVNNSSNGFINLHIDYTDILYNKNELFIDLCNTIEDKRSIKQLRDTHKTSIQSLIFRFKDDKHIKEIEFIKPNWDISKDSNGQPCVKLTWEKFTTETYTKR